MRGHSERNGTHHGSGSLNIENVIDWGRVVVGIPTYRRHALLGALLRQVARQLDGLGAAIVVADNECSAAVEELCAEAERDFAVRVHYRAVTERGISQARNALIEAASGEVPDWQWLVMYDDDGVLLPGCVEKLVAGAMRLDADAASGPVLHGLPDRGYVVSKIYTTASLPPRRDGVVDHLNGGQNTVVSRRAIDRLTAPYYAPELGLSGSEDTEFFGRVSAAGGRLVWVNSAPIIEPPREDRLAKHLIIRRIVQDNAVNSHTEAVEHGTGEAWRGIAAGSLIAGRKLASGLVLRDLDRLIGSGLDAAGLTGRALGLLGYRSERYR